MLYQGNLTVRFGRYFIWKHYQNLSFRILRNDNVFSLFLNRNSEVWQVARSMFRIVSGYFLQINSVIIHLVWLTSLSGIKVNIIQIWIRFFQIESGGVIKFIYRPVKHKFINVSFHRCCIILTRGSNCKSIYPGNGFVGRTSRGYLQPLLASKHSLLYYQMTKTACF